MKRVVYALLLTLALCLGSQALPALAEEAASPERDKIDALLYAAMGDEARQQELLVRIGEELSKYPADEYLRMTRFQLEIELGLLRDAQTDLEVLLKARPEFIELRTARCLIKESLGAPAAEYLPCYREVLPLYAEHLQKPKEDDMNYIVGALMAELPEAPALREQFIAKLGSSDFDGIQRELLLNFNRKEYLFENKQP